MPKTIYRRRLKFASFNFKRSDQRKRPRFWLGVATPVGLAVYTPNRCRGFVLFIHKSVYKYI